MILTLPCGFELIAGCSKDGMASGSIGSPGVNQADPVCVLNCARPVTLTLRSESAKFRLGDSTTRLVIRVLSGMAAVMIAARHCGWRLLVLCWNVVISSFWESSDHFTVASKSAVLLISTVIYGLSRCCDVEGVRRRRISPWTCPLKGRVSFPFLWMMLNSLSPRNSYTNCSLVMPACGQ